MNCTLQAVVHTAMLEPLLSNLLPAIMRKTVSDLSGQVYRTSITVCPPSMPTARTLGVRRRLYWHSVLCLYPSSARYSISDGLSTCPSARSRSGFLHLDQANPRAPLRSSSCTLAYLWACPRLEPHDSGRALVTSRRFERD